MAYRTPIQFQNKDISTSAIGGQASTYTDIVNTGGEVDTVGSRLKVDVSLDSAATEVIAKVRFSPTLSTIMVGSRMMIKDNTYTIVGIDNEGLRNFYITFTGRLQR